MAKRCINEDEIWILKSNVRLLSNKGNTEGDKEIIKEVKPILAKCKKGKGKDYSDMDSADIINLLKTNIRLLSSQGYTRKDLEILSDSADYIRAISSTKKSKVGSTYAGGGLTKAELKLNMYKPSGDYFMEKKDGKIILHLTSKDASNLPSSFFEEYNVEDNGKGYYGTSYIVSKKYAKGGNISGYFTGDLSFLNW
jgi:hypothetical protein